MPDEIDLQFDTRAFDAALKALPQKVSKKFLKKALEAGGDVLLASMKTLAPERTDDQTPDGTSLPPGILKEDLHTQTVVGDRGGAWVRVGPTDIAGHVCRWQNNGWVLTRGKRKNKWHPSASGTELKTIEGKHFMEGAVDEAGEAAVMAFVDVLAAELNLNSGDDSQETL